MSVEAPGVSFSARAGPIVDKGLVGPDFKLEDTMPLTINRFNLTGEIRFNGPQVEEVDSGLEQIPTSSDIPQVFVEAFSPDAKAKEVWDALTHQESPTPEMFHRAFLAAASVGKSPQAFGWPSADLEYVTSVLQETTQEAEPIKANKGMLVAPYSVPHPSPQDVKVAEAFEEEEKKTRKKKDNSFVASEEEIETRRKRFVLDEGAQGVVIAEIRQAVRKASALALKLGRKITGFLIARFLPGQHPGNESEAVKGKGSDGSIPERAEAIENHGEFATDAEAEEKSIKEAYKKPPIKVRKEGEGKQVKDEDVYRVFQDLEVKPLPYDVDMSEQLTATKVEIITESRIEDYPELEEVFELKQAHISF